MEIGRILLVSGFVLIILGLLYSLGFRWPKIPGDIFIQQGNFTLAIPIVSSIILSIIFTLLLNIFFRR